MKLNSQVFCYPYSDFYHVSSIDVVRIGIENANLYLISVDDP